MTDAMRESMADRREKYTGSRTRAKSHSTGDLRALSKAFRGPMMASVDEDPQPSARRLIVVSNRLSVTVKRRGVDDYAYSPSSGGLATGLAGMTKSTEFLWYGWPGLEIPEQEQEAFRQKCIDEYKAYPVFMSNELSDRHYNGFSNEILWALFHYHPQEIDFKDYNWEGYQEANRIFAKTVAEDVRDGDIVWVQDYHLMLLPAMLREELANKPRMPRNVKIGFFLHTPFPSSEMYRILPVRNEILEGVLHSDLIAFHTETYRRHFLSTCKRLMALRETPSSVIYQDKQVQVAAFPIGIEPQGFHDGLDRPSVQHRMEVLEEQFKDFTVIVGVDRLDYIKGMQQKLHSLDIFLDNHPEWVGKVKLIQVAVPSRGDVEEYQNLRAQVNQMIGYINGKYGTVEYQPVHFLHKSIDQNELIALYAISDACLVTSIRDGMNLVSFEYVACQRDRHGVLILSEFAGAADSLHGALMINPWDQDEVAEKIYEAVTMSEHTREVRYEKLSGYVQNYTSQWWGEGFVKRLKEISAIADMRSQQKLQLEKRLQHLTRNERDDQPESVKYDADKAATPNPEAVDSAIASADDSADESTTEEPVPTGYEKYANEQNTIMSGRGWPHHH